MDVEFSSQVWEWRGPAPYFFVSVPEEECAAIAETAAMVSYGWGMVPAVVRVGRTEWTTSLWPKDGGYVVPLKDRVRRAEGIEVGDTLSVRLDIAI